MAMYGQFGPHRDPAAMSDVSFRRALLHAIDRQQLVDVLQEGRSSIAHVFLGPNEPEYREGESSIQRYAYDPRRTAQLLQDLGYARDADGALRDPARQRVVMEVRSDPGETEERSLLAVTDFWRQAGVAVEPVVMPGQRLRDLEYLATYPSFHLRGESSRITGALPTYLSGNAAVPERGWVGSNRGAYKNAELDDAIDRYFVTIPDQQRTRALQTIIRHISDQLPVLNLFYSLQFTLIADRVENMLPSQSSGAASKTWNSHLWDVKPR